MTRTPTFALRERVALAAFIAMLAAACLSDRSPIATTEPHAPLIPARAFGDAPILVGAGDIADCARGSDDSTAALLDSIPGTVIAVGDNAYVNGALSDYQNCYDPTWGRQKARTRPATGNHDYQTPNASGYFGYFGAAAGDSTKGYYSYNVGTWHVVVLNSSIDVSANSTQLQWLKADLAASTALCTAAYWHHPRFSSGTVHGNNIQMEPAWQVLYDAGAEVVINGHEHSYERFAPQTPWGALDSAYGVREFVVGTGGGEGLYSFGAVVANSEVRNSATFGVIRLDLDSAGYRWHFIPTPSGTFSDSGSYACHGAPQDKPPVPNAGGPYASSDGTVHFDASGTTDPDSTFPLSYQWDFGDGNANDGVHPSHNYVSDGTYTVTLTVTDFGGAKATTTTTVSVTHTGTTVVFSGAGNIGTCNTTQPEVTAEILDTLPGFVFTSGDNVYPDGSAAAYANCYHPSWGRDKTRTVPVLGNYDYTLGNANGAFGYYAGRVGTNGQGYYSVDLGAWHIVVLNDNLPFGAGSAQENWLKGNLAANTKKCTMALWHQPLFFSSNSAGWTSDPTRQVLWNDLYAVWADVVVNGHRYNYERFAPMNPSGALDSTRGIKEFNVGTGGYALALPTVAIQQHSEVRLANYGVLKLTLKDSTYDWAFIPVAGQGGGDAGSGHCHGGVPPNRMPVANPGGPYASTDGTVHFNGSQSSDPDGDLPLTYRWDFGDGNGNDGVNPTHTYTANGAYTVSLTVTDTRGGQSTAVTTTANVNLGTTSVVLSGASNIATCNSDNDGATARLLDSLSGFVITLGDNAMSYGTPTNYTSCYHPTWGRHLTRTWPSLGNHDYDSSATAAGAFGYYGARLGSNGQGYYSVDVGTWHVIVLNDNIAFASGSAQEQWLRNDLAAHTNRCTLAVFHTPLFMSTNSAGWTSNPSRKILWDDLYAAGADVVLNGDRYDYERLAPMNPAGGLDTALGIREFNVGTGGYGLALPTVAIHPNSQVRAAVYGVLSLTLRDGGYDWRFVPVAGQTFTDSGSGTCH